jgi:hypothetical protein
MKKIILAVIILAAAGGAVYFFLQNKKTVEQSQTTFKQTILGDWKIDSIVTKTEKKTPSFPALVADSNYNKYQFRFKDDGTITQMLGDSILPVKHGYEWKDSANLVFIEGDSLAEKIPVQVVSLNEKELTISTADSTTIFYKKAGK